MAALPQELRLELLLVLAGWQLLDDSTCTLLAGEEAGGSLLAGAAAASLAGCAALGRPGVARLLCSPLPTLRTLSLKGVAAVGDGEAALIAAHCPSLLRLDLSKCPSLTDAAVAGPGGLLAAGDAAGAGGLHGAHLAQPQRLLAARRHGCHPGAAPLPVFPTCSFVLVNSPPAAKLVLLSWCCGPTC